MSSESIARESPPQVLGRERCRDALLFEKRRVEPERRARRVSSAGVDLPAELVEHRPASRRVAPEERALPGEASPRAPPGAAAPRRRCSVPAAAVRRPVPPRSVAATRGGRPPATRYAPGALRGPRWADVRQHERGLVGRGRPGTRPRAGTACSLGGLRHGDRPEELALVTDQHRAVAPRASAAHRSVSATHGGNPTPVGATCRSARASRPSAARPPPARRPSLRRGRGPPAEGRLRWNRSRRRVR